MAVKPLWVIDTSVAVKWFLNEPDSPLAERFLKAAEDGAIEAIAPASLLFEAASVFWVRRRDGVTAARAAQFLEALKLVNLEFVGAEELLPSAALMAFDLAISPYDAVFVHLALSRGARFVTADDKLVQAVGGRIPAVVRLASCPDPLLV